MAPADRTPLPPNYTPGARQAHGHFRPGGDGRTASSGARRMFIFVLAMAVVVVVVALVAFGRQPPSPPPDCAAPPCSPPSAPGGGDPSSGSAPGGGTTAGGVVVEPAPNSTAPPLLLDGQWSDAGSDVALEFDTADWDVSERADHSIFLTAASGADYSLLIAVAAASDGAPDKLEADRLSFLLTMAPDLGEESDPARQALGDPTIGFRQAHAALMAGTYVSGQVEEPWTVVLMSAGSDTVSIVVQLVSADAARDEAFQRTDPVVNSIRWP
jgi:hypothetical protein